MSPGAVAARTGLAAAAALAAARLLAGTGAVFDDRNGDGLREPGEPGLAAVAVSNGLDVVLTDETGAYRVPDRAGARVFVIKPRGWRPPVDGANLPRFGAPPGSGGADFPLVRSDEPDDMRALIFTDPQPSSPAEVDYLSRGLVERIGRRADFAFGVTLGDIVYDRPDLFGAVNRVLARIGIPWYSVPGNHDLALGNPDERAAAAPFEAVYGPSTYAFHAGPALFAALDDVRPLGGPRYIGGLRGDQFEFLENLLRVTPPDEWLVLMMHIPLFSPDPSGTEGFRGADRLRLFALLRDRPRVLILSGHTHYQRHVMHGPQDGWTGRDPVHEYNVAAASGGFWGGPRDPDGIPVATMWDGTPPGYAILGFKGAAVSLDYVAARMPAGHQMELHAPRAVAPRQGYVSFYANVFNGHDGWRVEARVDERAWSPMRRILGWDPAYAADFLAQDSTAQPPPGPRLPDPVVCYHLWRGLLPADLSLGQHVLSVRATDPDGRAYSSQRPISVIHP
ncbi:MAG TPA: calcineurin-like phosphoesterase family protein [Opitutaceae bacterium]|nr:calcineurin-like phosphoesterase family protein [Opitutaceae bacterium]